GRRDVETYGDATLQDLETRIYQWARELELQVRCRQTNHEGEFVGFCHDALGDADGIVVNPGAWTHYAWAIRDALEPFEGPLVEADGAAMLYTDFRYAERARAIVGIEVVEIARDLIGSIGSLLSGRRIAVEAPHVSYDTYRRLSTAGIDLVPLGSQVGDIADGPVEDLRRVKEPGEIEAIRRAGAISDQVFAGLAEERFTGR